MDNQTIYNELLKHSETLGNLDAKVDGLRDDVKVLQLQPERLTRVEGEVRTARRVFGGLWLLLVAGVAAVTNWLK